MAALPTIDFSAFSTGSAMTRKKLAKDVGQGCIETGFLCIQGHQIDREIVDDMRCLVVEVFAQPAAVKQAHQITKENYRGYIPIGFFTPNAAHGKADRYEGYKLHAEIALDDEMRRVYPHYGPNIWPPTVADMKRRVLRYWQAVDRFSQDLLRAFALALGLDETFFLPYFQYPLSNMTLLRYPLAKPDEGHFGIHPHKDSSAFTVLFPDPVGGLLIRDRRGDWSEAVAPDGGCIVNIGDVLEHWTGGHFVSTPHKVVNRTGRERHSFPYFAAPRFDVAICPMIKPVEGYDRPAIDMGTWHDEIVRSNWPDARPVTADFDPARIHT